MFKKLAVILFSMVFFMFVLVSCSENTMSKNDYNNGEAHDYTNSTNIVNKYDYKEDYINFLKSEYPELNTAILKSDDDGEKWYLSQDGAHHLYVKETSVVYNTSINGNLFEIGAFFEGNSALTDEQKIRIKVADGVNSVSFTREEQYKILLSLLKVANSKYDYSYSQISSAYFESKQKSNYNYNTCKFSDEITLLEEEFFNNGSLKKRRLFCDIYGDILNATKDTSNVTKDIAESVKNSTSFTELFELNNDNIGRRYYGIDLGSIEEYCVMICSSGALADEIAVFKMKEKDDVEDMLETVRERKHELYDSFVDYVPEEVGKIENAVIGSNGNYVYLIVCNKTAAAKAAVEACLFKKQEIFESKHILETNNDQGTSSVVFSSEIAESSYNFSDESKTTNMKTCISCGNSFESLRGFTYCNSCICWTTTCGNPRVSGSSYCIEHKCLMCDGLARDYSPYCYKHYCHKYGCDYPAISGEDYCTAHLN